MEQVNKEGAGAGVWIIPPDANSNSKLCSYKLAFDCTNNMVEYEALILGLNTLKYLGEKKIYVHGDSELVINQVKGIYQTKHPRMRAYRNLVLDLLEKISEYNISVVPREQNPIADALATSASVFKIPIYPNKKYEIEVKHRPTILIMSNTGKYLKMTSKLSDFCRWKKSMKMSKLMRRIFMIKMKMQILFQSSDGYVNEIDR
jgi:ribonuclease HI